ncbi:zinc-binding dehydrogenase [Idiomarina xiamenensis]|uniref:zinc-binding dehydrogenase n=1 Tax=Idiomarina xiamenensis TaxID=1207041 RepID=UPI001ED9BE52|nr:zinc-binding dehydrogenase [Idiomarina xiamenensis]
MLVHAGASGVGSAAIQLCRRQGNPCFVTVGSDEKLDYCLALGAEAGWNRRQGEFVEAVKQWGGVDVILDPVAGAYLYQDQQVLNQDGRIVVIGLMAGRDSQLDAGRLLMKRQHLLGSTLRSQPSQRKGAVIQQLINEVWPGFSDSQQSLSAQVDQVFERDQVRDAHAYLAANRNHGKVLLAVNPD